MDNIIDELEAHVAKGEKTEEDVCTFYYKNNCTIPYEYAEQIVYYIRSIQADRDSLYEILEKEQDYNRLLRKENKELLMKL